jgi:uncharacterized membrane protein required for colicin V production
MEMSFAQVFDIGAAFVTGFFVVRGSLRGLTGEIASLAGLIVSVACGWTFARPAAAFVLRYFPGWNRAAVELGSAVAIFMAVSLIFAFFAKMLRLVVRAARLSLLDHLLGAVVGVARAFCVLLLIFGAVSVFSSLIPGEWMRESIAMRGAAVAWPAVSRLLAERGWINPGPLAPEAFEGLPETIFRP